MPLVLSVAVLALATAPIAERSLLARPAQFTLPNAALACVDAVASSDARGDANADASASLQVDSALVQLYESGTPWAGFLDAARARREMWLRHATTGVVPPDALARAQVLPGRWRLLVVAVDACSDSVNTIPFIARLVASLSNVEMRVISPDAGKALMEARRTPDGRAATPTVIVLNEAGEEAGCWIERPAELQRIAIASRAGTGGGDFATKKAEWYEADAGASTINEVVAVLERAAAGARGCDRERGSSGL